MIGQVGGHTWVDKNTNILGVPYQCSVEVASAARFVLVFCGTSLPILESVVLISAEINNNQSKIFHYFHSNTRWENTVILCTLGLIKFLILQVLYLHRNIL